MMIPMLANDLLSDACIAILESKTGTVYKNTSYTLNLKPDTEEITVAIKKTDGKAKAIIYIYVDGIQKEIIEFEKGKTFLSKSKSLKEIRHKNIKVEIVNQSAQDKFGYALTIKGITTSLGKQEVKLLPLMKKTLYTDKACNEKINIKLIRKTGKAKTTVYIYRGNTKVWNGIWMAGQHSIHKSFSESANKKYKVEVKNISSKEQISFSMTATQL